MSQPTHALLHAAVDDLRNDTLQADVLARLDRIPRLTLETASALAAQPGDVTDEPAAVRVSILSHTVDTNPVEVAFFAWHRHTGIHDHAKSSAAYRIESGVIVEQRYRAVETSEGRVYEKLSARALTPGEVTLLGPNDWHDLAPLEPRSFKQLPPNEQQRLIDDGFWDDERGQATEKAMNPTSLHVYYPKMSRAEGKDNGTSGHCAACPIFDKCQDIWVQLQRKTQIAIEARQPSQELM